VDDGFDLTTPSNVDGAGRSSRSGARDAEGCGWAKIEGLQTLALMPDGTWTATSDGADTLSGTYAVLGRKGRNFDLAFDAQSLADLDVMLEGDLSELCQTPVHVTTIDTKRFLLKLNRSMTKAAVKAKLRLIGTANGQTGKGSFKVKAKGPWTSIPLGSPSGAFPID